MSRICLHWPSKIAVFFALPGASRLSSNAIKLPVVGGTGVVLLEPAINKNMTYINMMAANAPINMVTVHY